MVFLSLVVLLVEPKPTSFPPDTVVLHTNVNFYSNSALISLQNKLLLKSFVSIIHVCIAFSINFFSKNCLRNHTGYQV